MTPFGSLCDDFGVCVYLNTKMEMPARREAVLHFFESLQKTFKEMTDFDRRDNGDYNLEGDRDSGSYRWVTLEGRRLCTGYVNPANLEDVDFTNERVLETAPFHLDLSPLDAEALDVMYSFDFVYAGNHDEVVAEALAVGTPLEHLLGITDAKVVNYEPSMMLALDEQCRLQCRLSIETRTNAYQIRTGQFPDAPISVYFTVRQYWGKQPYKTYLESYQNQRRIAHDLVESHVIPHVIQPLSRTISAK
jgi:hypothetical protein